METTGPTKRSQGSGACGGSEMMTKSKRRTSDRSCPEDEGGKRQREAAVSADPARMGRGFPRVTADATEPSGEMQMETMTVPAMLALMQTSGNCGAWMATGTAGVPTDASAVQRSTAASSPSMLD